MKKFIRKVFAPLLSPLESGTEEFVYRNSHRKILFGVGFLFIALASLILHFALQQTDLGYYLPVVVFTCTGAVSVIVGAAGSDRAVAKIWGSK